MSKEIIDSESGSIVELVLQENVDIKSMIYTIRGQQVMLDSDLAKIYGYEVKRLNQQVKRNINRFPEDFMFQLTREEVEFVKSQIVTSRDDGLFAGQDGGRRKLPYAFTEQGVYMLATVLKGAMAEQQSVLIMRTFREMRKIISNNMYMLPPSVHKDIEYLKERQLETDNTLKQIMTYIDDKEIDNQKIFFEGQTYDAFTFIVNMIKTANNSIILIDGYTDSKTLDILSEKKQNVDLTIYSFSSHKPTNTAISNFNSQYPLITVKTMHSCHDRYLILDDQIVYCIGASIKDAGKKSFSITKFEDICSVRNLITKLDAESTP